MDFNNLLQKAASDQLQQKAVEAAEGIIKKAIGGGEDKEDKEDGDKKASGFDVGGIIQNVTGGKDDKGGGALGKVTSLFK